MNPRAPQRTVHFGDIKISEVFDLHGFNLNAKLDLDPDFFRRRLTMASEYRDKLGLDPRARREVWSESDGLPGLVLDRYGDCAVLQTLTLAMDQRKELIADAIEEILKPVCLIERNDAPVRQAEGLELHVGILRGRAPAPFEVTLGGVNFGIDLPGGQKTGLYLDQGANYALVAQQARGKRVLDCFSNQGGFALACALGGASDVTALDISGEACAAIEANGNRNHVRLNVLETNVFDWLKAAVARGDRYDLLDRLLLIDTWKDELAAGDSAYPAAYSLERLDYSPRDPALEVCRA